MATHELRVGTGPLTNAQAEGHNRWHPDIGPAVECEPGDELVLEMPDAFDGQLDAGSVAADARNALLAMIDHLVAEYGFDRQQAYALCSVAMDLQVSQTPDVPNVLVTAVLPTGIFT